MELIKLTALRDFAIEHSPRAQAVREQNHANVDDFHFALYGNAVLALANPTTTMVERIASRLIKAISSLTIQWEKASQLTSVDRELFEQEAISEAKNLSTLTSTKIPWLDIIMTPSPSPLPQPTPKPLPPSLSPGRTLTTKEAAEYLKMKPQTLYKWASSETGPLRPIKLKTRRLAWNSDDVIRILRGG